MLGSITNQKKKEKEKETLDISATYFQIAQSIIKIYKLMIQNTSEKTKWKAKAMTNLNTNNNSDPNIKVEPLTEVNALRMTVWFESKIWISIVSTVKN